MHDSALKHVKNFFYLYVKPGSTIVEVGSQIVEGQALRCGSMRQVAPQNCTYIGLDSCVGFGVDLVMEDPYSIPLEAECADAVVSSSTFEHVPLFWLTFLEMCRVLKPGGYLYVCAPSNGRVHRYPVDCWRFYPDAGDALTEWAKRKGYDLTLLESFIGHPDPGPSKWEDFVSVWRKNG